MEFPIYVDPSSGKVYQVTEFMISGKTLTQFYLYGVEVKNDRTVYNGYIGDAKGPRHVSLSESEYFSMKMEAEHVLDNPEDLDVIIPPVSRINGGIIEWEKATSLSAFMVQ